MRALFLALAMISTPAIAADQFDLVCKGGGKPVRYRIDLAKGEACSDSCDRVWKIGRVTSGEISVIDRAPNYANDLEERMVVNRQSGEWRYFMSLSGKSATDQGTCEVATFSGFPAAKF